MVLGFINERLLYVSRNLCKTDSASGDNEVIEQNSNEEEEGQRMKRANDNVVQDPEDPPPYSLAVGSGAKS